MDKKVEYQGYTIQSAPQYDTEWEKWRLRIFISVEDHQGIRSREFSSEVLYTTEQEADIHGIIFGQRLIDGKVEGRSVMDMKREQRRGSRRFRVNFPTIVSDHTKHNGKGIMLDLALGGCRLESPWTVAPGITLELRVQVPGFEWPLVIDGARVQWVREQFVGLAFVQVRKTEQQRLERVITDLRIHGADEAL